jgi:hypothetical protein
LGSCSEETKKSPASKAARREPPHQEDPLEKVCRTSHLMAIAHLLAARPTYNLAHNLAWQRNIAGATTKAKQCCVEATQNLDMVAFAFMPPASPFIQIIH